MTRALRPDAGFTLTEVLVAVMIFAMISAIALAMLTTALRARDVHTAQMETIGEVQRARALLREDVGQLVLRPFRGPDGLTDGRLFAGDAEGTDPFRLAAPDEEREILVLTRAGWANPGGIQPRSTLQRVAWLYDGTTLKRRAWPYPDITRESEPATITVLEEAGELRLEFLVRDRWMDGLTIPAGGEGRAIGPRAVRVSYTVPGLGRIEHVLPAPDSGPAS